VFDDSSVQPEGLLDRLAQVDDPPDPRGVRYRLATLLAIGVCAISAAGHNTLTAIADWVRRCDQRELSRLGCPFNPLTGRYRVPDERTCGRRTAGSIPRCWPLAATGTWVR